MILTELERGEAVTRVATNGLWVRVVAPTNRIECWISRDFVERLAVPPPTVAAVPGPTPTPAPGPGRKPAAAVDPAPRAGPVAARSGAGGVPRTGPAPDHGRARSRTSPTRFPRPADLQLVPLKGQGREVNRRGQLDIVVFRGASPSRYLPCHRVSAWCATCVRATPGCSTTTRAANWRCRVRSTGCRGRMCRSSCPASCTRGRSRMSDTAPIEEDSPYFLTGRALLYILQRVVPFIVFGVVAWIALLVQARRRDRGAVARPGVLRPRGGGLRAGPFRDRAGGGRAGLRGEPRPVAVGGRDARFRPAQCVQRRSAAERGHGAGRAVADRASGREAARPSRVRARRRGGGGPVRCRWSAVC